MEGRVVWVSGVRVLVEGWVLVEGRVVRVSGGLEGLVEQGCWKGVSDSGVYGGNKTKSDKFTKCIYTRKVKR